MYCFVQEFNYTTYKVYAHPLQGGRNNLILYLMIQM